MGLYTAVQSSFDSAVAQVSGLPRIVSDNAPEYTPTIGVPFCRTIMLPAEPSLARSELGVDGATYFQGLYQIYLSYPRANGAANANTMADQILSAFTRGTTFSSGGINITVLSAWRNPAIADIAWWSVPVVISWYSLTKIF